jgi:hypothetical protein
MEKLLGKPEQKSDQELVEEISQKEDSPEKAQLTSFVSPVKLEETQEEV